MLYIVPTPIGNYIKNYYKIKNILKSYELLF